MISNPSRWRLPKCPKTRVVGGPAAANINVSDLGTEELSPRADSEMGKTLAIRGAKRETSTIVQSRRFKFRGMSHMELEMGAIERLTDLVKCEAFRRVSIWADAQLGTECIPQNREVADPGHAETGAWRKGCPREI